MKYSDPFHNRQDEWDYYHPLHGDSMLELGGKINNGITYKSFFEAKGFRHVSIDWNGEHGAIRRDLRQPLWDEFGQFDMVCNIGTTEHVSDQRGVWENIHHMTKKDGYVISVTPYHDGKSWWWHGEWYPTEDFFVSFAEKNGYSIERMGSKLPRPHTNLYVRMRKTHDQIFKMPDEKLIKHNTRRSR